jgi:hypothetical protein
VSQYCHIPVDAGIGPGLPCFSWGRLAPVTIGFQFKVSDFGKPPVPKKFPQILNHMALETYKRPLISKVFHIPFRQFIKG